MARPKGNPDDLIRRIEAALKATKPRDVVGAVDMAAIVSMTWRGLLVTHIEPDGKFPIQKRGAEGVPWEFRVVAVLKHMLKRAYERKADNDERARKIARLTGYDVPDTAASMNIAEISKLIDANSKAFAQKAEQKVYVPAEQVRLFIAGYNRELRDALLGERQKLDPIGAYPAEIAEAIDDDMRDLALTLQRKASRFVEEWCAAVGSGGTA